MNGLRSLDWRFLLPTPRSGQFGRLVLVGADEATLHAAVEARLAAEVVDGLEEAVFADAVVCLQGSRAATEAAVAALAPGGVLYREVDRGRGARSNADIAVRELARLGLRPIGSYWPHPAFNEPRVYLPLDAPGSVAWYFRNLFVIKTAGARLLATATRLAASVCGRRLRSLAPRVCLVFSREAPAAAPGILSAVELPEPLRSVEVRPLVLMGGGWWSRVVVLPFRQRGRKPIGAVKVWRTLGGAEQAAREQRGQRAIRALLPPALTDTVPEPLALVDWARHVVTAERSAEGEWLVARRHRRRRLAAHLRELELVSGWLTAFGTHAEAARRPWSEADVATWVSGPLAEYRDAFGMTEQERHLGEAVLDRANQLVGATVPFVWCHNDFSELNTYFGVNSITVIDWERVGRGLPATDLLSYLPRWFFHARRIPTSEGTFPGFRTLFVERESRERAVAAARAALRDYSAALELDDRLPPLLLVGEWVRRAAAKHRHEFPDGAPPERARAANRYARYVSILASHNDHLFGRPYRWGLP